MGADITAVEDVLSSMRRFGDRYVRRVFTSHEIACCRGPRLVAAASLAARFAAKEATIKVLRPDDHAVPWRSIEVRRHPAGFCELRLSDGAAALAEAAGITELHVSLSHEAGMAAAVVVASCASEAAA
ncbi:MAG TPA: holo-ACP synthase [Acidimicrobiales bacterium]|nr:holo-ACP synthase [Acidimicrobiales bacterium]